MNGKVGVISRMQPEGLFKRKINDRMLYSHVVVSEAPRLAFVSGQLARNAQGQIVGKGDMSAQIRQVGENLRTALRAVGANLEDLVSTTTYVTDIDEFFRCSDVRTAYFGPALPTSTTIEVRRLSHPDLMVEIEAIAALAGSKES